MGKMIKCTLICFGLKKSIYIFFLMVLVLENKIQSVSYFSKILLINLKRKTTCDLTGCLIFALICGLKKMNWQINREVSNYLVLVLSYCSGLWFIVSDEKKFLLV